MAAQYATIDPASFRSSTRLTASRLGVSCVMTREEALRGSIESRDSALNSFTDQLVTLSSGALTLSIAFRQGFSAPVPVHLWLLSLSWIAFTLTILAALAVKLSRVHLHTNMVISLLTTPEGYAAYANAGCLFTPARYLMMLGFGVAIVSLAAFALYNLK